MFQWTFSVSKHDFMEQKKTAVKNVLNVILLIEESDDVLQLRVSGASS